MQWQKLKLKKNDLPPKLTVIGALKFTIIQDQIKFLS